MKRALVVLVTCTVVSAGAAVAYAKGPVSVTITGPGVDETIDLLLEVEPSDPVLSLMQESALWGGVRRATRLRAEPLVELGPAYAVVWVNSVPAGESPEERVITQVVYPHSAVGPVIHTPSQVGLAGWGQEVVGWFRGPESLADTFVALGATAPSVDITPAPARWKTMGRAASCGPN